MAVWLADRFEVVGLSGRRPVGLDGCRPLVCDWSDDDAVTAAIRREAPRWIIHCGPLSRGSWDLPSPSLDAEREARRWSSLCRLAAGIKSRLTLISTDAVFEGPRMFHAEESAASSSRPAAEAARNAERAVAGSGALVVRTHAYGWSPGGHETCFAQRVWQSLHDGVPVTFDQMRHATPILASDLAELLWLAYRRGLQGLCHIAGAERSSDYHFALELAAAFGLAVGPTVVGPGADRAGEGRVAEATAEVDPNGRPHLGETSLDTRRAHRELRRPMPMLREGLERFAAQAASFRARLQPTQPDRNAA